jgi:hypothetical protein
MIQFIKEDMNRRDKKKEDLLYKQKYKIWEIQSDDNY